MAGVLLDGGVDSTELGRSPGASPTLSGAQPGCPSFADGIAWLAGSQKPTAAADSGMARAAARNLPAGPATGPCYRLLMS